MDEEVGGTFTMTGSQERLKEQGKKTADEVKLNVDFKTFSTLQQAHSLSLIYDDWEKPCKTICLISI